MRSKYAITDGFKPPEGGPFYAVEMELTKAMQTRVGVVGKQAQASGQVLPGGGTQGMFVDYGQRHTYIKVLKITELQP